MNKEQIKTSIIQQIRIIAPDLEYDDIPSDENLQNSLEIDSYDFLHLLTALYEQLGVQVPEVDYGKVDTLNRMAEYFAERIKLN
ncbi:MAG TPA: phosphopantetheine-binding protein [Desulfobacter postgatei]|uniref:acyl carrier protein n=1 Tax=Desulfobacter sp. TaxID=2294 RepID=UPI000E7D5B87|nr:phosphopantetheine-binding protein [Desulfobacter sp.]HBT88241.1 phosphopantetheine-binding protein [Desulfobacter sp.]HRF89417.1 phosphopantetheine-binding protein [Desulfobacter postgatei]